MTTPREAYDELVARSQEIKLLDSINSVIGWDQETYMPRNGAGLRARQSSYLSGLSHRQLTDPRFGELLEIAESGGFSDDLLSDEAVNLREWRHSYDRQTKVPTELVEELAHRSTLAVETWRQARKQADFSIFKSDLAHLIELNIRQAECIGYEDTPYDALLDAYEPGDTTANVARLFRALRAELAPLVQEIAASSRRPQTEILTREFPVERQRIFGQAASAAFGFDFAGGRIDTVTHPFCSTIGPGDTRITTRFNPRFFNEGFFGILHESGHALYGQNLPADAFGTPRGAPVSLGIHESQSRLWENFVGRGRPFWRHFFPRAQQTFPAALGDVALDDFYFAVNEVKPSYIRVEADEVTYNLHIMLRFEIEQAIIAGDLAVDDIPDAWNTMFKDFVGIDVPDDSQGCLQDIHWAFGGFGYFSTYALGNLYGAQIFAKIKQDIPDLEAQIARGEFGPLLAWLVERVYSQGKRYRSSDLIEHITGSRPSHEPLVAYLRAKFGELYDL